MSSITWSGTSVTMRSMSASLRRNSSGDQSSNVSEYCRTAASPRSATSAMTCDTVRLTWGSLPSGSVPFADVAYEGGDINPPVGVGQPHGCCGWGGDGWRLAGNDGEQNVRGVLRAGV